MTMQVIKVGGAALNDAEWLKRFAEAAAVPVPGVARVVVHGGGPEISALAAQMGLTTEWHEGRRITSEPLLDVTSMVLTGRINKRIVRALRGHGVDAMGLSGEDGGLVQGELAAKGQLGRVGEVVRVRSDLIRTLLDLRLMPVLSPVSLGDDGGALNINADEVATSIAAELKADELLFLTDVEGVRVQGTRAETLTVNAARQLIADQVATGGMALKLRAAVQALQAGVSRVRVGPLEMLWDVNAGTVVNTEELACK
jgi:acetylglutamate kinase